MLKASCKKKEIAIKYRKKKAKNNNKPQKAAVCSAGQAAPRFGSAEKDVLFRYPPCQADNKEFFFRQNVTK